MPTRILTGADVQNVIDGFKVEDLVVMTSDLFQLVSQKKGIVTPHRLSIDTGSQVSLFMPSFVTSETSGGLAIKIVSVPKEGDAGIGATTLVIDPKDGSVKGIVNARKLTALRTAAGSALATKLLANPQSENLVVFGAGAQMEEHVNLLAGLYPSTKNVTVINRTDNKRLASMLARLNTKHPTLNITHFILYSDPSPEYRKTLQDANIICCATSSTNPLFPSSLISAGTHLNLIGSYKPTMHEIDSDLIRRASKVVVDSKEACLIEAGELIDASLGNDDLVELGEICGGDENSLGLQSALRERKDVTIFKSVGVGAQDVMIAGAVLKKAEELGVGSVIDQYD